MFYMDEHIEYPNNLHGVGTHSHPLPVANIDGERGGPAAPPRRLDSAPDPHTLSLPSTALHHRPRQCQGLLLSSPTPVSSSSPQHPTNRPCVHSLTDSCKSTSPCPLFPQAGHKPGTSYTLSKHVLGESMNMHVMITKRGLFRARLVHSPVQKTDTYLTLHTPSQLANR